MIIQHNITALNAYNNWAQHSKGTSKALARLSSGYRINSAADDPAGLAISEKMRAQITQLQRQKMNAMDSISSIMVSEGAQNEVSNMLLRMQELATQSMNGVYDDNDRKHLNEEYQQLLQEIDRINGKTNNSSISLFRKDGKEASSNSDGQAIVLRGDNVEAYLDALDKFLVEIATAARDGDNEKLAALGVDDSLSSDQEKVRLAVTKFTKENAEKLMNSGGKGQSATIVLQGGDIKVNLLYKDTADLGLAGTDISNVQNAGNALNALKKASSIVTDQRAHYGAVINRLEHSINYMTAMEENMEDALSRVVDADMAKEMMNFTRSKAMEQTAMYVMTHAMQEPQQVLQLLKAM